MRTPSRTILSLAAAAALAGGIAAPASAADTSATVAVESGTITLTAPASFDLGGIVPGKTTTSVLAGVKVTDERAGQLGWVASVSVGEFSDKALDETLPADAASYSAEAAVVTGTATLLPPALLENGTGTAQTATAVRGNNSAVWDAVISVEAPSDALAGTYSAKIVHSVI